MESDTTTHRLSAKVLGTVAMVAFALQPLIVWAFMLLIAPDVPWTEPDSNYALGDFGWLRKIGFIATGIGALALGLGIRKRLDGKGVRLTTVFLYIGAIGQFGAGIFNTDPTTEGSPHDLLALVSLIGLLGALFSMRGLFARNEDWKGLATPTLIAAMWFVGSVLVAVTNVIEPGFVQRLLFLPVDGWLIWIAWNVRQGRIGSPDNLHRQASTL